VDNQVKQRVVGAIVLVALAVIFLPFLLPGKGDFSVEISESNVPPAPEYKFPPLADAPKPPPLAPAAVLPVEADQAASPPTSNGSTPAQAQDKADKPLDREALNPASPGAVERLPQPGEVSGWVVQLGSFGQQANALGLRDKLRAAGYRSFVEPVKAGGSTSYRVRVGPEVKREAAEALAAKIQQQMNIKGLVQQYP
jgi:DedD protein